MPIDSRFKVSGVGIKRDVRPWTVKFAAWLRQPDSAIIILVFMMVHLLGNDVLPESFMNLRWSWALCDIFLIVAYFYFRWFIRQPIRLPFKLPSYTLVKDPNNPPPGKSGAGKAEGILFLGNVREGPSKGEELWLTNSDARTHILFMGTTGAGKTEGLKSLATNALTWGSGFVYVDGKAQNTLWGDIYSLARRFGRDDDLLILNYMTGNADGGSHSNTLNPFSIGSASYLTQMMTSMMDDSGDDNAMWKGRAIALLSALMPALTWKRDHQGLMLDVGVIRDNLTLQQIIKLSRDPGLPDKIIRGLQSYLDALPGFMDSAFDDDGNERPQTDPNQPAVDLSQTRQQHGYLTMQFTRALQSLADEYGHIFKQQMADIDMMDVVLNRRILVVLIPALEKSPDEAANLGKIVVAALKGMMGATLGAAIEGSKDTMLDNNPTESRSPFITIFDEVGYYTSPGMGVMAAQARSLGFSLVFASQDLPAMQKRVKEEAMSITGNCNLKIFGKLEDPTETRDFFEKTVSSALVSEVTGYTAAPGGGSGFMASDNISVQSKKEAGYDDLRRQTQGQVHFLWADKVISANFFYANPPRVQAIRVQRFLPVSNHNWSVETRDRAIAEVAAHLKDSSWRAVDGIGGTSVPRELTQMVETYQKVVGGRRSPVMAAAAAVGILAAGMRRSATDAVPANVGVPQAGHWPLGAADATGAPPAASSGAPPWMNQGMNQAAPAENVQQPSSAAPPWMSAPAAPMAPPQQAAPSASAPPWMSAPAAPPPQQASASAPAWMSPSAPPQAAPPPYGAPPMQQQQQPAAGAYGALPPQSGAPLPPWAGGGAAQPMMPPQQQGYAAPPPYAPQQQANPFGSQPAYNTPPVPQQQQQGGWGAAMGGAPQMPQANAPLPPWAGGGGMPQQQAPQASGYGQPPMQQNPYQPPYAPQQQQGFVPPPMPPQQGGGYAPPQGNAAAPFAAPPPHSSPDMAPEIDAILRNAAENLAAEMFPNGQRGKSE